MNAPFAIRLLAAALFCFMVSGILPVHAAGFFPGSGASVTVSPADNRNTSSLSGKFLVASKGMRDPRFAETVIILIDHGNGGALGVIINKPSEAPVAALLQDIEELQKIRDVIFIGGPVAVNQLLLLVRTPTKPVNSKKVFGNVYVTSDASVIGGTVKNRNRGERFRIYSGYAGWAPGQLEREIARGDWQVTDSDAVTVFDKDSSTIWPDLIMKSSVIMVNLFHGNRVFPY